MRNSSGIFALLPTVATLAACSTEPPRPFNLLLIVSDTLRSDVLSCYGGDAQTPNICGIASRGVLLLDPRTCFTAGPLGTSVCAFAMMRLRR